jgi:hypothetical protein
MLQKALKDKIGEEKTQSLIKELKGDEEGMLQITETIREENAEIREEGIKIGRQAGKIEDIKYNIPINVDTTKEGYPILCA